MKLRPMSKMSLHPYTDEVRGYMQVMFNTLTEKGQRHYAAIEAIKLGHGGIGYIGELFDLHRDTISQGIRELKGNNLPPKERTRRPGGGRKKRIEGDADDTVLKFSELTDAHRAGCPMNENIKYTHLTPSELSFQMASRYGLDLSRYLILQMMGLLKMTKRPLAKTGIARDVEGRNEQFENIESLITEYREAGCAIFSVDGKKKEFLGQLYRPGRVYCQQSLRCFDHDFPSLAKGKVSPYGIYDLTSNKGFMFLNESADTSDYAADCLDQVLSNYYKRTYPNSTKVLILADGGGSNGYNRPRYKEMLQWLADNHSLEIRVAHYPSYCSKYNPCDHRLFPHVTRAWSGVMLDSPATMRDLVKSRASTKTGLKVFCRQIKKNYAKGITAGKDFIKNCPVVFDELLPKWNYTLKPVFL